MDGETETDGLELWIETDLLTGNILFEIYFALKLFECEVAKTFCHVCKALIANVLLSKLL